MVQLRQQETQLILRIIKRLGEGDDSRELRSSIAPDILHLLGADHMASYSWSPITRAFEDCVFLNMDPANLAQYDAYYRYHDPITPHLQRFRRATLVRAVMPQADLERTEFWNDFLMRDGLHHGINLHAYDGERHVGDLRVWRSRGQPLFGRRERVLLELLKPYFLNAMRHARSLRAARCETDKWAGMWEAHPHPAFVFACDGRELHRNIAAHRLLSSIDPPAADDLLSVVRRAAASGPTTTAWQGMAITVVRPQPEIHGAPYVLVQLTPTDVMVFPEDLSARWGFTKRETEIGVLLAKRLSDKEIAEILAISVWTVRAHVRNVYAKVGASTRSEFSQRLTGTE